MISLRTLGLSLITTCLLGFVSPVEGACPGKNDTFRRAVAIQQSENVSTLFAQGLSEAVQAAPADQAALVLGLTELLTTPFSVSITSGPVTLTATDFSSLLVLVQAVSADVDTQSTLVGSFTLVDYDRAACKRRNVAVSALSHTVTTYETSAPTLGISQTVFTVNETCCDVFKINSVVTNVLNRLPFCCPTP